MRAADCQSRSSGLPPRCSRWLLIGTGFLNYDTAYSLLWGGDLAHGRLPDFDVPLAPTPHPLRDRSAACC